MDFNQYDREQDERIQKLKDLLEADYVKRRADRKSESEFTNMVSLVQWVPVYLSIFAMFVSGANIYAQIQTRLGTLETRINYLSETITEIRDNLRDSKQL